MQPRDTATDECGGLYARLPFSPTPPVLDRICRLTRTNESRPIKHAILCKDSFVSTRLLINGFTGEGEIKGKQVKLQLEIWDTWLSSSLIRVVFACERAQRTRPVLDAVLSDFSRSMKPSQKQNGNRVVPVAKQIIGLLEIKARRERKVERTDNQIRPVQAVQAAFLLIGVSIPRAELDQARQGRNGGFHRKQKQVQRDEGVVYVWEAPDSPQSRCYCIPREQCT